MEIWRSVKKLGGNADVFENKGVAKKAIHKCLKMRGMQIDGVEGATHKVLKTKESKKRRDYALDDQ